MALSHNKGPHFVLFPFLAQGHMIPMVDIARLLARRGVVVTILLTPLNAKRIQPVVERAVASGLTIHLSLLRFPCVEAGLPQGCENFDMLPSMDDAVKFFNCTFMMKEQVRNLLIDLKPNCLIADMCFPWATDLALELRIPRLVFNGMSCFALVMWNALETSEVAGTEIADTETFVVPNMPDRIEITKAQLRGTSDEPNSDMVKIRQEISDSQRNAFGTVANTFEELEPDYVKEFTKRRGKVWCVGPVSLCNEDELDKAERGNKASIDQHECLEWLDLQKPGSVVYACLGSISRLASSQLIELGLALEALNRPFIWVVRDVNDEFKAWLKEENFEEMVKTRPGGPGFLIHGWAPQVLILSHPSVGCFLTHCGWNSTLEGITAGVPMATWPVFAEQFCNEKFVVNVIKTGVRVGVEMPVTIGEEERIGVQVRSGEIKMAIEEVLDGGDEGHERREKARKLGEMAKRAMAGPATANGEDGGSSYKNLSRLIQDIEQAKLVDEEEGQSTKDGALAPPISPIQVEVK